MKGLLKTFTALVATVLFWSSQANAVLIEFVPSTLGPLTANTNISVDIVASDLGGDVVSAFDILVEYDETILNNHTIFHSSEFGAYDADPWLTEYDHWFSFGTGETNFGVFSWLWNDELALIQDGASVLLFTMSFKVLADADSTALSFVWDEIHDVKCGDPEGFDAVVCSPTAVPEPGTLALLALGLLGMAATRRRQKI